MSEEERELLYWLVCQNFLGAVSITGLYGYFGSFSNISRASEEELKRSCVLSENQTTLLISAVSRMDECREEYASFAERGISSVTFMDSEYPRRLKNIGAAPPMLIYKGRLPSDDLPALAIVGARASSRYGEELTAEFARMLASQGVQIISGLATGIDAAAHAGAMKADDGRTFAVLGCGITNCYPQRNFTLYEDMQRNGGVMSEFPLSAMPLKKNFPMRNRIISGLADAVLVTEAREKSGSLITAEYALDQGKEVFAVPGRITDALSKGPNALIAEGARPALEPDDILEFFQIERSKKLLLRKKNTASLANSQKKLYNALDSDPKHLDVICAKTRLPEAECLKILLQLQLDGYVQRTSGQYYSRKV